MPAALPSGRFQFDHVASLGRSAVLMPSSFENRLEAYYLWNPPDGR
jgi:hypothetical protein